MSVMIEAGVKRKSPARVVLRRLRSVLLISGVLGILAAIAIPLYLDV